MSLGIATEYAPPAHLGGRGLRTRSSQGGGSVVGKRELGAIDRVLLLTNAVMHAGFTDDKPIELKPVQLAMLMHIAKNPGVTQAELMAILKSNLARVSRMVGSLAGENKLTKAKGFELVESVQDPEDARRMLLFLTPKGKQYCAQLLSSVMPGELIDLDGTTHSEWRKSGRKR